MKVNHWKKILGMLWMAAGAAPACDFCAARLAASTWDGAPTSVSLSDQYSKFDRPSAGGHEFTGHALQLSVSHRMADRWSVQADVPCLDRKLEDETESGLGDVSLIAAYRAINRTATETPVLVDFYAGVKAPTGNTDPLEEERIATRPPSINPDADHDHDHADADGGETHETHAHGHHLALGSGSWDLLFGARGLVQRGRWSANAEVQYIARTEGDFDFEYGDEFVSRLGARYFVMQMREVHLSLGPDVTREWRDENKTLGQTSEASSAATYVGPAVDLAWPGRLTVSVAWDVGIEGENEGLDGAADQRARASLALFF